LPCRKGTTASRGQDSTISALPHRQRAPTRRYVRPRTGTRRQLPVRIDS